MYTFDDYTADEDWLPILSGEHSRLAGMTLTWGTDLFRQGAETGMRGRGHFLHRARGFPRSRRSSVGSRRLSRDVLAEISALVTENPQ